MSTAVAGWPGARYHADFKNMGMMVGGTPVFQSMRGIWVDCIECGRRDAMRDRDYSLRAMSTDEARRIFTEHGWTIKPTRCPACVTPSMPSTPTPPEPPQ